MNTRQAYRSVLAIPDARALIAASAASQLGDWLYNAALLGYVYHATGSAGWVAVATICRLLPYVLLGPAGGVVADRYDRRAVLLAGAVMRGALMLVLALVVAAEGPVALVVALTTLSSAAGSAERPAAMALLPRLSGEAHLGAANALLHTVQDLGVVVGPAAGAILLALAPPEWAFVANGLTFAASATLLSRLRVRVTRTGKELRDSAFAQLQHGLRTARHTPFVGPLFLVVAVGEFVYGAQTVQLVVYAQRELDLGASGYGYLLSLAGAGGVSSVLINHRLAASRKVSAVIVAAGAVFCATEIVYAGTNALALVVPVTLLGGVGLVACEVVVDTALARVTPVDVLGRVMGVFDAVSVAAMIAGAVLAPVLIAATSLRTSLALLGVITMLTLLVSFGGLRGLDAASRRRADAIAVQVALLEKLPIASGLPAVVVEQLAAGSQTCPLPAGVDVVVEGAPAHAFYAVLDGTLIVHRAGKEVATLGAGDFFGERGLLDHAPRNASVTTASPTTLLRLEGDVLMEALQATPALLSVLDRSGFPSPRAPRMRSSLVDDPVWSSP